MLKIDKKTGEVILQGKRIVLLAEYATITNELYNALSKDTAKIDAKKELELAFETGFKCEDEIKKELEGMQEPIRVIFNGIVNLILGREK